MQDSNTPVTPVTCYYLLHCFSQYFGNLSGYFGNSSAYFGCYSNKFGYKSSYFGNKSNKFGNSSTIFGNSSNKFGNSLNIFGNAKTMKTIHFMKGSKHIWSTWVCLNSTENTLFESQNVFFHKITGLFVASGNG